MQHNLTDKRALITGAGQGLGRALAETFCSAGAEVIITDIDHERISETVEELRNRGFQASGFVMDVTDADAVRDIRSQILENHGPIDILINNAGIVHGGRFVDIDLERHRTIYEINTLGVITVTHVFLPDLIDQPDSHLVNICSASGLLPLPYGASYASSKSATYGFSESIREEMRVAGHSNVHVTAVCPSYISTGLFTGVKPPRFTKLLTPEYLAGKVLKAVRKNKDLVLAPWNVNLIPIANGILPRAVCRWLLDWLGITSGMSTWQGHVKEPEKTTPHIFPHPLTAKKNNLTAVG